MTEYNKAWTALVMAVLMLLELYLGVRILPGVSEDAVLSILAIATPILVWLVPNWSARTVQRAAP